MIEFNKIIQGDCLEVLKTLPDESIDCVITSPPYWGLRDYGTAKWEGGDINCDHINPQKPSSTYKVSDEKRDAYAEKLLGVQFKGNCKKCGAKRIDSQLGLEKTPEEYVAKMVEVFRETKRVLKKEGTCWLNLGDSYAGSMNGINGSGGFSVLKSKDLVGIPWRVAFALQADGWYLRQDIIWHKPNPMPESVTDRCTKSHEYVFLLAKSPKYYFDNEAIKEQTLTQDNTNRDRDFTRLNNTPGRTRMAGLKTNNYEKRNKRSVWTITTKPFKAAHFATFPEQLIEPMVKAGCPENGIVLDMFMGGGTTAVVAKKLNRNYLGIELNSSYIDIANKRIDNIPQCLI